MYLITPKTDKAEEWIRQNVYIGSWQWLDQAFVVDHHYIENLELGMVDAGLTTDDVIVEHV